MGTITQYFTFVDLKRNNKILLQLPLIGKYYYVKSSQLGADLEHLFLAFWHTCMNALFIKIINYYAAD